MSSRTYYSIRTGKNPNSERCSFEVFKNLIKVIYEDFERQGYFQEVFGYFCVDQGDVFGSAGSDINAFFLRKLKKKDMWPITARILDYKEDDVFDLLELLFDYVSKPIDGYYHSYSGCGWHSTEFDQVSGQQEYRSEINAILRDYGEGFELSENGEILILGLSGAETLLEAILPECDPDNVEQRVQSAVDKYRRSRHSIEDRHDAIRDLGDVFEYLRPQVKVVLSSKDESDLFNILNNFGIRHHNPDQKTDYDEAIWLSWLFYHYLAGIHACIRLIKKHDEGGRES